MKKLLVPIIFLVIMLLIIIINNVFQNKEDYYLNVANEVVSLFEDKNYDQNLLKEEDKLAFENIYKTITHENEIVKINFKKTSDYYTDESNTKGIFKNGNDCFMRYNDINFKKTDIDEMFAKIVCDNYFTLVYYDEYLPEYNVTVNNPVHDYIFLEKTESFNGLKFSYTSSYDGSKLDVIMDITDKTIDKIEVKFS